MSQPEIVAGHPIEPDTPAFAEPWQAQAFALVIALAEGGKFSWNEWAAALSQQVHRRDAAEDGSDYYHHWMRALETLLVEKGMASPSAIEDMTAAWQRAAHATPHGKPIELANDPGL
ncbi:MAG: nitrile hydratase accessory protein [Rhizobiaceae bacterium]|nr:nitrile hydratase accessory protein [Rhizobiaceae bacterium]